MFCVLREVALSPPPSCRIHLAQLIGEEERRQLLVAEVQASVARAFGDRLEDRGVLEKDYVEQVLLLRKAGAGRLSLGSRGWPSSCQVSLRKGSSRDSSQNSSAGRFLCTGGGAGMGSQPEGPVRARPRGGFLLALLLGGEYHKGSLALLAHQAFVGPSSATGSHQPPAGFGVAHIHFPVDPTLSSS